MADKSASEERRGGAVFGPIGALVKAIFLLLFTEKSGLVMSAIQVATVLLAPQQLEGTWAIFAIVIAGWYPSAQTYGLRRAVRDDTIKTQQVSAEWFWSILPAVTGVVLGILSLVATYGMGSGDGFLIMFRMTQPAAIIVGAGFVLALFDLANNGGIANTLNSLGGRLRRFEEPGR